MTDLTNPHPKIKQLASLSGRDCRIAFLFDQQQGKCHYCQRDMVLEAKHVARKDFATKDHVIPRCRGGKTTNENCVAACAGCNIMKGSMSYSNYMTMRQEFLKGNHQAFTPKQRRRMANNFAHIIMEKEIEQALEEQTNIL